MFKVAGPMWAQAAVGDNAFARLAKAGKKVLRRLWQRKEVESTTQREIPKPTWSLRSQTVKVDQNTSRLIGGLFPKQLFKSQASELRRQAALRLVRDARKVPVFAFVGLSLGASLEQKTGGSTNEALFSGIRDLFQQHGGKERQVEVEGQRFSLQSLQLGQLIGQGCNAAVFEARPAETNLDAADEVREENDDAIEENSTGHSETSVGSGRELSSDDSNPQGGAGDVRDAQEMSLAQSDTCDSSELFSECEDSRSELSSSSARSLADSGRSLTESGSSLADSGSSMTDAGSSMTDSGSSMTDSGSSLAYSGRSLTESESNMADSGSSLIATEDNFSIVGECLDDEEDSDDDDFTILSEEEAEEEESEESLDGWVLYRLTSAPESPSACPESDDNSDDDIIVLAGDEEKLQSLPDLSWDFTGLSLLQTKMQEGVSQDSPATDSERSSGIATTVSPDSSVLQDPEEGIDVSVDDVEPAPNIERGGGEFPLAVKMMYNYSVESNADHILSAMAKETVPVLSSLPHSPNWPCSNLSLTKELPPHPNLVAMYDVFVDQTPDLPEGAQRYPSALPKRLNREGGFGRNATMFLVMKKYNMTLNEFLSACCVDVHTRCLLFAQLLEGVVHLQSHGIAHRDLKSNNILIDLSEGADSPHLTISDFGSCLADRHYGLKLPYLTPGTDRGGNSALMAPEIKCAEPGPGSVLDYSKADVWAAGALAYEIFGGANPFYSGWDSRTYCEDNLPQLPSDVPEVVVKLVKGMLKRNPEERPTAATAATCLALHLWGPPDLCPFTQQPNHASGNPLWRCKEICHWLERLTVETVCQRVFGGQLSPLYLQMKSTFLSRVSQQDVFDVVTVTG